MHGRTPAAVLVLTVAAVALSAAPAPAQFEGTADQAQARSDFPVYEITRRLGLPASYGTGVLEDHPGCSGEVQTVAAELRRGPVAMGRRWITMRQANSRCAVAAAGKRVRRVRVFGRRVMVRYYCWARMVDSCKGRPAETIYTMTFSLRDSGQRTFIELSARLSVRAMLRAVRSLRRVDLSRPVVALNHFRSPDGRILCSIYDYDEPDGRYAFCATGGELNSSDPSRSARVSPDGTLELCDQDPFGCIHQWDSSAPLLAAGQTARFGRFTCTEQAGAITCTVADDEHAGKGFRIDLAGVAAISP